MNGLFIRWLTLTGAIVLTSYLLDGIRVSGLFSAFLAAAVLGILNAFFRPIALLLTLPINILTLGFFTFVINALMLKMASGLIPGFDVIGLWPAILGSLMISVISWLMNTFVNERGTFTTDDFGRYPRNGHRPKDETIDLENKGNNRWE